jgi:Leucine-rich repeat (LRR) protein
LTLNNINVPEGWWEELEPQWRQAFQTSVINHNDMPDTRDLNKIFSSSVIRLAGPTAPFPNMKFELTNVSGLQHLHNLSTLIVTHHRIENIEILRHSLKLKSLFLFNNNIKSLHGIEDLELLEQLYVQTNQINSIKPVERLIRLKEFYINDNCISSLDGLTEKHSEMLTMFVCRPNPQLRQKEIIYAERELGIICR